MLSLLAVMTSVTAISVRAEDNPEAVAQAYFAAMQTDGLLSSTRFMHPIALEEFKTMLMPVYTAENAAGSRQLLDVTFSSNMEFADLQAMDPATFMNGFMSLVVAQTGNVPITFPDDPRHRRTGRHAVRSAQFSTVRADLAAAAQWRHERSGGCIAR
jgi:hypothetical protein